MRLLPQYHPERMDDAGEPAKQGEENVEPELQPEPDLKKDPERWQNESQQDADNVQSQLL